MRSQINLASKILAYDNDETRRNNLKAFCQDFNLNGVCFTHMETLIETLEARINVGAVIMCDEGEGSAAQISRINLKHPEIPVFVSCEEPEKYAGFRPESDICVVRFFKHGDFSQLDELISAHLFNRVYPDGLVERMQEIVSTGIKSAFNGVNVIQDKSFMASDKRIFGERFELISIRSNWCEGVMMIQSQGTDVERMIRAGRTSFPSDDGDVKHHVEDLLRELLNYTWGGFKAKFVPPSYSGRPTNIEVPISINMDDQYISFGVTDPLLCFKFVVENGDTSRDGFEPFVIFLKFSFHLYWQPDTFQENPEMEELSDAGELEFF